ncbi:MAG TPA: DeoR/GlpR family DNA-binding transcription regulator [Jatrophihabitantaceae bacterium]|jgi:DeoR/GlpR family transcriptional regulator of sugar metabolism|nr:DeoR/GlpR family DNA-binding transcription regulator [Jatrophihabitantaceae bacterium]
MFSVDRQRLLLQHLRAEGSGNVLELAETLGVSASTVRRDLKEMDDRGLVNRVHGGASVIDGDLEPVLSSRSSSHSEQKKRIAKAAALRVPESATVLITGGTTTEAMLPHLAGRENLTVLTNGLSIAYHLARYPEISVVVLGGVLRHDEMSLLGPIAEHVLADFRVDVAFFSAFGIDATGLSAANVNEAGTDRRILQHAESLVALMDASKFGQRGPVRVADIDQLSCLVTDDEAPSDVLDEIRSRGVEIIAC